MSSASNRIAALAQTSLDPRATHRPALDATEPARPRAPSPFASARLTLPAVHVHFPGGVTGGDVDIRVKGLIAEGGMGRVYLAEQRSLARDVAVKTVKDATDGALADALVWEGAITGHLDHPGVTPVHALGAGVDGAPLLVMKRIVGVSWTELMALDDPSARVPTLPKDRLRANLEILMQVARTLHHAHLRGVVHLDVKPDNVMIGELGEVYVVDWGVATTLDRAAAVDRPFAGTPAFVAPEVVRGEPQGAHTDVYLCGATLHLLLTGRARHDGASIREVLERAIASEPFAYDEAVPAELAALANAATARDPQGRPRDALAFHAAVAEHLEHDVSLGLARDGAARLAELLRVGSAAPEPVAALRLATEARYAFRAALERWADNCEAKAGLARTLEAIAELEVARENLVGAREAAAELDDPPPALVARIDELAARLRRRAESEVELARVRDDQDLGDPGRAGPHDRGASARRIGLFVVCGAAVVATLFGGGLEPIDAATMAAMPVGVAIAVPAGGFVVIAIACLTLGRRMLSNVMGRRLVLGFLSCGALMTGHRALLLAMGVRGVDIVAGDLLVVAAATLGMALFVTPRAWVSVLFPVLGAIGIAAWPRYPTVSFNLASAASVAGLAWALRARPGSSSAQRPRGP